MARERIADNAVGDAIVFVTSRDRSLVERGQFPDVKFRAAIRMGCTPALNEVGIQ